MPFGFARSVIGSSAGLAGARGAFRTVGGGTQSNGSINNGSNHGWVNFNPDAGSNTTDLSIVMWVRAVDADTTGGSGERMTFFQILDGTGIGDSRLQELFLMHQLDSGDDQSNYALNMDSQIAGGGEARTLSSSTGSDHFFDDIADTAETGLINGKWNCLMVNNSIEDTRRRFFLNGVNAMKETGNDQSSSERLPFGNDKKIHIGHFVNAFPGSGAEIDIGPVWIYDSEIDFSSSSVRAKYFDAANTDGFVDGGTDGTAGGADAPEVYIYHNGSTIVNGGTQSGTLAINGDASGDAVNVTLIDASNGPGSGVRRAF